jgi:hypothetical protein
VRWPISVSLFLALASIASADEPPAPGPSAPSAHLGSPIAEALDKFDFGDYEGVVALLRPIVDNGARALPTRADRIEALRVYGIACTLTDRLAAAEGSFLLLLREEPATRLDPALVRPEAVVFLEQVRARHREELLAVYRRSHPRSYWFLNLLPPVGQFQNRQRGKGFTIGALELVLLTSSVTTYSLLAEWQGGDHTFSHHESAYEPLRVVNILSFSLLVGTVSYGILDGFIVGHRLERQERDEVARLGYDGVHWGP